MKMGLAVAAVGLVAGGVFCAVGGKAEDRPAAPAVDGPGAPANLRCEYRVDPIGLDGKAPRLSWEVSDPRRGAVQSAYRVLVAADAAALAADQGPAWDSGKVDSDRSIHVAYAGKPLESGRRYRWKVRTWDGAGRASPWSAIASFEMGLLDPKEWSARWITIANPPPESSPPSGKPPAPPAAAPLGRWIWHPKAQGANQTIYVRRTFAIEPTARVARAVLRITADNSYVLFVNGKEIGSGDAWEKFTTYDVAAALVPGKNAIAVEARNVDGPCGLIAGLRVEFQAGGGAPAGVPAPKPDADKAAAKPIEVLTDEKWLTCDKAGGDWKSADCAETGWLPAAVIARFGEGPWVVGEPAATPASRRSLCFRKEIALGGKPVRARAFVSGLGVYELRINGQKVGNDVFTPGWTDYGRRVQYQTYDVTGLLRDGANAIAAICGSGWWNGMNGRGGNKPTLILQMDIEQADGKGIKVVTDDTWKAHASPILEDAFYHGETYDARLEMPGWDQPGFDEKDWLGAAIAKEGLNRLVAEQGPTIQVTAELPAVSVAEPKPGIFVFDFGQNAAGRCRLKISAPRDTRVQIRHAEVLKPDGTIYTDNYRSARATDVYFCKGGGEEVWEPRFTYRGFRYAEVTGLPTLPWPPGKPPLDTLVSRALHSAAPPNGRFECSNETINRVWRAIVWGQRSNMHSVPTDCPQRDERLGWTGDAQIFAPTACWNMDMALFFGKWTRDMTGGAGGGVVEGGGPGWDDVRTVIPWTLYRFYADERILEESYKMMTDYVEGRRRASKNDLFEQGGYGDWIAVVGSPDKPIGSAYYYNSVDQLARTAAALGKTEDAKKYAELAERIAKAFNAAYLDKDNKYPGGTQTAYAIPLAFGLVPAERRAAVVDNLVADVVKRGYHPSTGFLGTPCLLPALTGGGRDEVACRLAEQKTYPSWGYMIEAGGTTIWELWNSDKAGPGMNSRNHFALGACGQWYFEALAGINIDPDKPGFKHIVFRPRPAGDLTSASADYRSMFGPVRSAWRIKDGRFALELTVPANATATVHVPAPDAAAVTEGGRPAAKAEGVKFLRLADGCAIYDIGSGSYSFAAPWTAPAGKSAAGGP